MADPSHNQAGAKHDHSAPGHTHGVSRDADKRGLTIAFALILGFMVAEVVVGFLASSLALLADAGHMLTDATALGLSLLTIRLAAKPATGAMTFGLKRSEILSAQFNGASLLAISALVIYEAIRRLLSPAHVHGGLMLGVALAGIGVNLAASWALAKANRQSLNVEGSFQHILTDLYAFIGTAIAAAVIILTGYERADPIASLLVAGLMLRASYGLLRDTGRVLLEMAPKGMDPQEIGNAMVAHRGVFQVHDLHVWEVTSGLPSLSAHVLVDDHHDCHEVRRELDRALNERFGIEHTTLQVDHKQDTLVQLSPPGTVQPRTSPSDSP
jgi:cobalt-zinc-cadmium efflux system protein